MNHKLKFILGNKVVKKGGNVVYMVTKLPLYEDSFYQLRRLIYTGAKNDILDITIQESNEWERK